MFLTIHYCSPEVLLGQTQPDGQLNKHWENQALCLKQVVPVMQSVEPVYSLPPH